MLIHQKEISDLMTCSYHNWHENFKKHCIKSHCLPIPDNVLNYLKQDLFVLPTECKILHSGHSSDRKTVGEATNFDESDDEEEAPPSFPEFSQKISKTIEKLGKQIKYQN
jgi:hypothetical protein